jgi:hypothetical protein
MANTLTVKTDFVEGISVGCDGFSPVVRKRFDTSVLGMAANAQIVAFKVPEGCIIRHVIVDVKTAGTATVHVGSHIGALTAGGGDTDPDDYTPGGAINLATPGKHIAESPAVAIIAANHYVVVNPQAAESAAVFDVLAVVEVFDVDAYTN